MQSDLSSTENSDSVLVKNMDYPLEVRKNWSAAKERPKEVIEHDSYQVCINPWPNPLTVPSASIHQSTA